jgi:hypothetical protein
VSLCKIRANQIQDQQVMKLVSPFILEITSEHDPEPSALDPWPRDFLKRFIRLNAQIEKSPISVGLLAYLWWRMETGNPGATLAQFGEVMGDKLNQWLSAKRYSGWDSPRWTVEQIKDEVLCHVSKGNPIEVANLAAFWWNKQTGGRAKYVS